MKLHSEGNKTGHEKWLRRIRTAVLVGGLGTSIPWSAVLAQAPDNSKNVEIAGAANVKSEITVKSKERELSWQIPMEKVMTKNKAVFGI
jgi:hypothetical protein